MFLSPGTGTSLTSIVCKIFESFIKTELFNHILKNNLLSSNQFGFCPGRSCATQLLVTLYDWLYSLDNRVPVDCIYMDFKKAFDSVPHQRLLVKLKGYGIEGNVLDWISDFLKDRSQYVSIDGHKSSTKPVISGVPQGSVLGPTLFIYFINDLPEVVKSIAKMFADDTKSYSSLNTYEDHCTLQSDINSMDSWTYEWLLFFNNEKCKCMHLGKNNPQYIYTIGKENDKRDLETTYVEKDLGVHIDPLLKFDSHISQVLKKCKRTSSTIMKTINYKTRDIMLPLFKSLVRPVVEYANIVWSPYLKKDIHSIENIQRHYTKQILGMRSLSYRERLFKLKLPSLQYRRLRGDLIETYKILNNYYDPVTISNLLELMPDSSSTRNHNFKLRKKAFNSNQFKYFYTNRIVNVWNKLPASAVNAKSLNNFKNRIDHHFKHLVYETDLDLYY